MDDFVEKILDEVKNDGRKPLKRGLTINTNTIKKWYKFLINKLKSRRKQNV